MKIGVVGPESTASVVLNVVKEEFVDIQAVYRGSEFFEESGSLAEILQSRDRVEAILFTGATVYANAMRQTVSTVPWRYVPRSRIAVLQAFLEAITVYQNDLQAVSVDCYEEKRLREVLDEMGIHDTRICCAPYDPETPGFEKRMMEYHRDCYRKGLVSICFTNMEHIREPLLAEGIPCIRLHPPQEVIREQIYQLQILNETKKKNQGKLAVIVLRFDYIFDEEENLNIREWEKMDYRSRFEEKVYAVAERLGAAVFNNGSEQYYLAASREMMENVFLKSGEHQRLIQYGCRPPARGVWIGIGIGNTMLEAKSRALKALNRSIADRAGYSYLVEDEAQISQPIVYPQEESRERSVEYFAHQMNTSPETLRRTAQVLNENGDVTTAQELAKHLGITIRSVNRILSHLDEAGYLILVGTRTSGKGRPARLLKITMPECFHSEEEKET